MHLFGRKGWGSAIVEAQLVWYGMPFEYTEVGDLLADASARTTLAPLNPVAQVPTLLLDSQEVLSESAAMTLWLAEKQASDALVPAPGSAERARFLRWLVYLVANIYPTFTYADVPTRFVSDDQAAQRFRAATDRYAETLWLNVEAVAAGPWFLGTRFSAIDIYLSVMTRWRPKRAWFAKHAPRLHAAAVACDSLEVLLPVWQRNFKGTA